MPMQIWQWMGGPWPLRLSLFWMFCFGLNLVSWRLFNPTGKFHAPPSRAMNLISASLIVAIAISLVLSFTRVLPMGSSGVATCLFLAVTELNAIRHHLQTGTRTWHDLVTSFFGG